MTGPPAGRLDVTVHHSAGLRFDDGTPVRAASGIAPFADGWLVAQDDATHAAWWRGDRITALRLFAPVDGHDLFSEAAGTKRLKTDLEAACAVHVDGRPGTLLLGSGSLAARTRAGPRHRRRSRRTDRADGGPRWPVRPGRRCDGGRGRSAQPRGRVRGR